MSVAEAVKFADLSLDEKLDRLAEVAVRVGLGLRSGQELIIRLGRCW
jgi:aminopeptidase